MNFTFSGVIKVLTTQLMELMGEPGPRFYSVLTATCWSPGSSPCSFSTHTSQRPVAISAVCGPGDKFLSAGSLPVVFEQAPILSLWHYANPLHMSIFLLHPHPIYNCPACDEAVSEVPEGKLLNWERRKRIFMHERFQVLPSLLSPSASLLFSSLWV